MAITIRINIIGIKAWMAIEDGVVTLTKIIDDETIKKKVSEYTREDNRLKNIFAKAEMIMTSVLEKKEYKQDNNCK